MKYSILLIFFLYKIAGFAQDYKKLQAEAEHEYNNANFPKALELSEQALKAAGENKKATRDEIIELKADRAVGLFYNDKVDDAINNLVALVKEIETKPAGSNAEIAVRMDYAAVLHSLGLYSNAMPEFKRAYDLCKSNGYDKQKFVSIISSLGECYQYTYYFDKAEDLYKEAINYCEKNDLVKSIEYPTAFTCLASLYQDMMYEQKALDTYKKTETIFVTNKDTLDPQFAVFLSDYGTLLANTYQYEKALGLLVRSKALYLHFFGENSAEYAGILNNLGYTYDQMGRLMETEQYYTRSLEIKRGLKRNRFDYYLTSVNNLRYYYSSVGREEEADALAEELAKGLQDPRLQDTLKRMTFAENLAEFYSRKKLYIKAANYLEEAVFYSKSIFGDNNLELGNMYISMSILLWEQKKNKEALQYMKLVEPVIEQNSKVSIAETNSLMRNMAVTLSSRFGKYAEAETYINKCVEMVENKTVTNKKEIADIYFQKAQVCGELEKISGAINYFNKYLDLKYSQIDEDFKYMTEEEKLQFMETFDVEIKNFFTSISNHVQKHPELIQLLLNYRIQAKGLLLNNLSKIKKSIIQQNDPALNEKFERMKLDRENISKLMSLNTDEYAAALSEVNALKAEADQLEKEISARVSKSNFSGYQKLQWKDIQKQLLPNECAVEIVRTNLVYQNDSSGTNYSFIILKNSGSPALVMMDRPISWEQEILEHYRNSINAKKDDPDLYRRLWKGIRDNTGTCNTIYLSADGIYNQVNLNTLFNAENKKYVIEECNVHYLTTLRDLEDIKTKVSAAPANVALIGNPVFDYDLSKLPENKSNFGNNLAVRGAFGFKLEQLPGTKKEIETINSQLQKKQIKTHIFTEEKANESAVKKINKQDVLHFATHGFFLEDLPQATLDALSKTERSYYSNPMMRSGIFLSGANNTYSLNTANVNRLNEFEDGTLTAYEVMNMDLDKTELVVLSACETGLGKVKNGEGVFGLQRAFKLAGAKSVIMSLWPVSDEATMELMIDFYNRWAANGDIYSAFKEAQLETRKKYPDPYYWGAFVLNGR